jgi:hypothetical protein
VGAGGCSCRVRSANAIPFLPKVSDLSELGVEPDQFRYISDARGGSAFMLAGTCFWLGGALFCLLFPNARVEWVLYAGLSVPFLGVLFARLQGAKLLGHPRFAALAGIATLTELAVLPSLFFLRNTQPEALPAILLIADGAHLVILMWLHLDYSYFLAGNIKIVLGTMFLFTELFSGSYPPQLAAGGVVSLVAAVLVWRDSGRTASLYSVTPTEEGPIER